MKTTPKPKPKLKRDLLVGTWTNADDYEDEVEYTITRSGDSYAVRVRDCYDGEAADIFETAWDKDVYVLSFAAHWNSTGRFARYRIFLFSVNRIEVSYTYTDHARYDRKRSKRK